MISGPDTSGNAPQEEGSASPPENGGHVPRRGRPSLEEAGLLCERILDAGWAVLLAEGFEGFTFDKLARHARIGKATIYSRYPNKHAFFQALLEDHTQRRKSFLKSQGSDLPLAEAFRLRAETALQLLFSPDGVLADRLIDWLDQEAGCDVAGWRGKIYRAVLDDIEEIIREGNAREALGIADPALAARFWLEGVLGHARLLGCQSTAAPAPDHGAWARAFTGYFFRGVSRR